MKIFQKIILGAVFIFLAIIISLVFFDAEDYYSFKNLMSEDKAWGAYVGHNRTNFSSFENLVGIRPDIYAVFSGWYENFPVDLAVHLKNNGQTLVIFWEQYDITLDQIVSGESDDYIKQYANNAKLYGGQIILAPLHEMNGEWSPWSGVAQGNTPEKTKLAFQHIRNVFMENQMQNVKWAWVVNNRSEPNTEENKIENYYPGDNYVDFVGVDGFNFGEPDEPWLSYTDLFSNALTRLEKYNKPIYIFSMASAQGSQKPEWIRDALSKIKSDPRVKGFIWFNENKEKNWLVNSDQASLEVFRESLKDF